MKGVLVVVVLKGVLVVVAVVAGAGVLFSPASQELVVSNCPNVIF